VRRGAALGLALAALGGCGGGDEQRDPVALYIDRANATQRESAGALEEADATYRAIATGQLSPEEATRRTATAVAAVEDARAKVAAVAAPAAAAELRHRLLVVYDRDLDMARQTSRLVRYEPALAKVLARQASAGRRLRAALRSGAGSARQAAGLRRYAADLAGIVRALDVLRPPRVARLAHRTRLRRLATARRLATGLASALRRDDRAATASLLERFRAAQEGADAAASGTRGASLRSYRRHLQRLGEARAAVQAELRHLQRAAP
jgi:hypothetical protein